LDATAIVNDWQPRYNIAPTQPIAAIVADNQAYRAQLMRWGLVPFWADDLAIGNRMINARAETLQEKPAFRGPLAKRRCAIVADGYYEWQKQAKAKQPFWIHRPQDRLFAFAGLWDTNRKASDQEVVSATIITTVASDTVSSIHDRMPAVLTPEALVRWLDPSTSASEAAALLADSRELEFEARAVSTHVNNPLHEDANCLTCNSQ
jgi:putative SOS response-associated peptidase YedK